MLLARLAVILKSKCPFYQFLAGYPTLRTREEKVITVNHQLVSEFSGYQPSVLFGVLFGPSY